MEKLNHLDYFKAGFFMALGAGAAILGTSVVALVILERISRGHIGLL
jgi:hypothetical protein